MLQSMGHKESDTTEQLNTTTTVQVQHCQWCGLFNGKKNQSVLETVVSSEGQPQEKPTA